MNQRQAAEALEKGETVTLRPHGNSMTPIIKSGQAVTLAPITRTIQKGDAVLAKVHGNLYIHKVTAIRGEQYQISNNHGHVNGWTTKVYGIVTDVQ